MWLERLSVGRAHCPWLRGVQSEKVAARGPGDAATRVGFAGVAVPVVGEQHRIAEEPGDPACVGIRRGRVVGGADDKDWMGCAAVPWTGVGAGGAAGPGGTR